MGERNLSKNSRKTTNFSKLGSKKFKEDEKLGSVGSNNSKPNIFEKHHQGTKEPIQGTQKIIQDHLSFQQKDFEHQCLDLLKHEKYEELECLSVEQLDLYKGQCSLGFFYLGISLYKLGYFEECIKAFIKCGEIQGYDAQLNYNLGIAYFKLEEYS
jgi:tetratricopeptide (TPR) repeat protein